MFDGDIGGGSTGVETRPAARRQPPEPPSLSSLYAQENRQLKHVW